MKRLVKRIAGLAVAAYLALIGVIKWQEPSLVYHPTSARTLQAPAAELGLDPERVEIRTPDSVRVVGWAMRAAGEDTGVWMLVCHGNYQNISFGGRPQFYAWMRDLGINVLAFDYRGFGESDGRPSEQGLYTDAEAAYRWLREVRGVPAERIVLFGHSLGSGVAIELASRVPAAALVVEGAFTSVPDRGRELYPYVPVHLLASERFASIEKVGRLAMPKLFLHSPTDDVIPFAHGERLFAAAAEPKRFVSVRGGHDNAFREDREAYYGAIRELLARGTTSTSPTEAASANAAPSANAEGAPSRSQTTPKSSEAGSAPRPTARLNQPNAVPRLAAGTRSATSARSVPSTRPE